MPRAPCSLSPSSAQNETKWRPILSNAPLANCRQRSRLRIRPTDKTNPFCRSQSNFASIDYLQPVVTKHFASPAAEVTRTKCKNPRALHTFVAQDPSVDRQNASPAAAPRPGTPPIAWQPMASPGREPRQPPNLPFSLNPSSWLPAPPNPYSPNLPTADMSLLGNVDFVYQLR